jgi:hypothetical protein
MFRGSVVGGVLGFAVALGIGIMDAPVVNPADPLAHEWYTPVALIFLPCLGACVGALMGLFFVQVGQGVGKRATTWGFCGLFLGLAAGLVIARGNILFHFLLTAGCIGTGLYVAALGSPGDLKSTDEFGE